MARIAEIELSTLSLDALLRESRIRVTERLSFDRMITSCNACCTNLNFSFP